MVSGKRKFHKKFGYYPIATRAGLICDRRLVFYHNGEHYSHPAWEGWWWSEPLPDEHGLPPTPYWDLTPGAV